jgi:subtilase family serine protease
VTRFARVKANRNLRRVPRAAVAACALAAFLPATASAAGRIVLHSSRPDWARPSTRVGNVPSRQAKTFWVYLKLRHSADLDRTIAAVSDPSNAAYGRYLSPSAFAARYAPTAGDVASVKAWLKGAGFDVASKVPGNRRWVQASGDVAQVEHAFSVQLRTYRHAGKVLQAPSDDVAVPRSVAGVIAGVTGLDGSDRLLKPQQGAKPAAPPSPAFVNAGPCSDYWGQKLATGTPPAYGRVQPYAPCGYVPSQLQGAYGVGGSGLDGSGQTVAIVDAFASPTIQQDANTYAARHGQPAVHLREMVPPGLYDVPEDEPTGCDPQGWYGEETLDVEAVHAMAPRANEIYAGAVDCNDESLIAAVTGVVEDNRAQIISNSYGGVGEDEPVGLRKAWEDTFRQAAAQGIGIYFSSGDDGDEVVNSGTRTVDYPASEPLVTAVGGTSLGVDGRNGYQFETGWGTSTSTLTGGAWTPPPPGDYLYGGGGGTSRAFKEPAYQQGVVPNDIARYFGRAGRAVPDVAAVGDPQTGMRVGQTQTFPDGSVKYSEYRIGGTSLSSPLFAGVMALADQAARHRHGFANPLLYSKAGSRAFHDVLPSSHNLAVVRNDFVNGVDASDGTTTKLRSLDTTGTIHTRRGYDDVTGLGTPNGQSFLQALAGRG